ncbi:MAG: hypothetical protein R3E97_09845 [Candidatus Eisenbacteria bacterium]
METKWTFSQRWVDTDVDRARWRSTAMVRVVPSLQIGVEINPAASEVGPLVTWFLLREEHRSPALFLGTSSDRIGTQAGDQAYFLTVSKALPRLPVSANVTLNYSEADESFNVPFGAALFLPYGFNVRPMYDGERTHLLVDYTRSRWSVSVISVWMERLGLSVGFGF